MKIPFEWENLIYKESGSQSLSSTDRAKVYGGWIVNTRLFNGKNGHESMVFIPDVNHEWVIEK